MANNSTIELIAHIYVGVAFDRIGTLLVRASRSRYAKLPRERWNLAHLTWKPDEKLLDRALEPVFLEMRRMLATTSPNPLSEFDLSLVSFTSELEKFVRRSAVAQRSITQKEVTEWVSTLPVANF